MTISEAITKIDSLKPNTYTQNEKIYWLSQLDGIVKKEIIDTHEGYEDITFNGYTSSTSTSTTLLVPHPYDDIYIKWLESQIDYANAETARFNNSITMYNTAFTAYERYYNRTNKPLNTEIKYF